MCTTEAPGVRECPRCRVVKPLDEYYQDKSRRNGVQSHCKACNRASTIASRLRNREDYLLRSAVSEMRRRAKQKGIEFDLSVDWVRENTPDVCPALGLPLSRGGEWANSPSIDRIDPTLGYTPDNCVIISQKANTMKSNATPEELMAVAVWLQRRTQEYWHG